MSRSHEALSRMNIPHPDFRKHYEAFPVTLTPSVTELPKLRLDRRKHIDSKVRHQPISGPIPEQVTEKEVHVTASDGFQIPVTVYSPTSLSDKARAGLPVVVLMHEGGWHLGDRVDEEVNSRLFVRDLDCVVLNVEYRLAPEMRFPRYVEDCYEVLQHLATDAQSFHELAKPDMGIVLGGSSAGGNLAATLAQKARVDDLQPSVTGQWLSVAALLPSEVVPEKYAAEYVSGKENMQDPVIGELTGERWKAMEDMLGLKNVDDINYTPFATSIYPPDEKDRGKLAKAFLQVAGMDPLRDESLIYERALREEWGVETRMKVYEGYGHMFWTNWPEMAESRVYWKDMIEGMRWLLGQ